ncbi:glycoside hydrolase family 43 protein [Aspergillus thermomutatus]|uniref:Arabinosidase n=1 Tax=Aspergillus thermomutatus TaxID=41047 RepID=A0A397G457_ASPTH|nr:uncharacterized protein CDV56_101975 [Aspergillus thermomutatus]RHZ45745.1 hypothetical protein CDV56_101975 [Aspergillus thermomutatus]
MKSLTTISAGILALLTSTLALPQPLPLNHHKADSSKVGYLGVYWKTSDESVYYALSNNSDPLGFTPINGGNPIVSPTLGTKAIRDVSIIKGVGHDKGKYYLIGTDLKIADTTWAKAVRTGSRGIFVWESSDLLNWAGERLVTVEEETAGMVWAPDAIWDARKGKYLVHWASQFYAANDTEHTGNPTTTEIIRYAHTSDFKTFTKPQTYIDHKTSTTIDLSILPVDENTFVRFYVNGNVSGPVVEVSDNGLFGDWTSPSGTVEDSTRYEGPYPFWDNVQDGKAYLVCDKVGSVTGWAPWESTDVTSGQFTPVSGYNLASMRHGSVLSVTQEQYDALAAL